MVNMDLRTTDFVALFLFKLLFLAYKIRFTIKVISHLQNLSENRRLLRKIERNPRRRPKDPPRTVNAHHNSIVFKKK